MIEQAKQQSKIVLTHLKNCQNTCINLSVAQLYEAALVHKEARLTADGALSVETGKHTGRSAQDKFIVRDALTEKKVWWAQNSPISKSDFEILRNDMLNAMKARTDYGSTVYVTDLIAGADPTYAINVRVITEHAWQALFIHNMLIVPEGTDLDGFIPDLTIIDLPNFKADPQRHGCRSETVIACDFTDRLILIGGTSYAGEIKKSVFTAMNFILPTQNILPMHCSANMCKDGHSALFFGLSGTGKTTLSTNSERALIGDDEHGWGPNGIFNIEGGCYAKTEGLSARTEPEIFAATRHFGTVLENVVLHPTTRVPDFDDTSLTSNARCAYDIEKIGNIAKGSRGKHPKNIVMLAADAFGLLPPLAKLDPAQAQYYFLSGYTAKLADTEKDVVAPTPVFSACFGAPFMPLEPILYAAMLAKLIHQHRVNVWLLNTGWFGGVVGEGQRMPLQTTRRLLDAALKDELATTAFHKDPVFGLHVPTRIDGIETAFLMPHTSWADRKAYNQTATRLVGMFEENFKKFAHQVEAVVAQAAPKAA